MVFCRGCGKQIHGQTRAERVWAEGLTPSKPAAERKILAESIPSGPVFIGSQDVVGH